ncbi:hypothetical protein C8F01DRAFT_1090118 [Mycena amicta]|nr:hypothetical protein C8F01DRAFT_1090118 [Mycena amicta]
MQAANKLYCVKYHKPRQNESERFNIIKGIIWDFLVWFGTRRHTARMFDGIASRTFRHDDDDVLDGRNPQDVKRSSPLGYFASYGCSLPTVKVLQLQLVSGEELAVLVWLLGIGGVISPSVETELECPDFHTMEQITVN